MPVTRLNHAVLFVRDITRAVGFYSEYRDLIKVELLKDRPLTTLTELRPSVVRKLLSAGLQNVRDVLESDVQGLMNIRGIGQKTAEEIVAAVNKELNQ